jgi:hypothetical protein
LSLSPGKLMSCYEIEKINWVRSNHKSLMVIKERISKGIRGRGVIPECETVVEYLEKVESQFTDFSKAYASSLIKRLISEKYTGVRCERSYSQDEQYYC